jgi:hypothetical protein
MASRLEKLIGGLLGEDVTKMDEEERRRLVREGGLQALRGMLTGSGLLGGLETYGKSRQARRDEEESQRGVQDIMQAQAAIAGRLGARGADVGEQTQLAEVRPMAGMNLQALMASPAGAAALQANPQLAEMLKQRTGYQVAGADIFNRETGQFMQRPSAAAPAAKGVTAGARPSAAPAAAGGGSRFVTMTPDQLRQANLPEGTSAQLDTETGQIKIISAVPATQRTGEAAKGTAVKRVDDVAGKIVSQLENVRTGGPLGVVGALSRVFDSQDAKLFESYRQQLSSALRTALRIPGEGALSDFEQRQYGLQLPELGQSAENNKQIIQSLQNQVRLAAGLPPLNPEEQENAQYIYRDGRLIPVRR